MRSQMTDVDVVVIGAGCGGLSAAALLAGQGRRVLVLDQNGAVGGCASSFERDGYTFDVAASIFEVLEPLQRTLGMLGTSIEQEIDLLACDPTCAVALRDGKKITFPMGGIVDALRELSAEDARNWSRYASYCEELYDALLDTLYVQPASTLGELVAILRKRPALLKYLPTFLTSYQAVLARYFSDRTQQALAFQALTLGLPPALLPGIYSFLPYGELRSPHYPRRDDPATENPAAARRAPRNAGAARSSGNQSADRAPTRRRCAIGGRHRDPQRRRGLQHQRQDPLSKPHRL